MLCWVWASGGNGGALSICLLASLAGAGAPGVGAVTGFGSCAGAMAVRKASPSIPTHERNFILFSSYQGVCRGILFYMNGSIRRIGIFALLFTAALPAMADTQFRVRRMTRDDVPMGKGQCD